MGRVRYGRRIGSIGHTHVAPVRCVKISRGLEVESAGPIQGQSRVGEPEEQLWRSSNWREGRGLSHRLQKHINRDGLGKIKLRRGGCAPNCA